MKTVNDYESMLDYLKKNCGNNIFVNSWYRDWRLLNLCFNNNVFRVEWMKDDKSASYCMDLIYSSEDKVWLMFGPDGCESDWDNVYKMVTGCFHCDKKFSIKNMSFILDCIKNMKDRCEKYVERKSLEESSEVVELR